LAGGAGQAVRPNVVKAGAFGEEEKRRSRPDKTLPQVPVLLEAQVFIEQARFLQQLAMVGHAQGHGDVLLAQEVGNLVGEPGVDLVEVRLVGPFFEQIVGEEKDIGPAGVLVDELQILRIIFIIVIQIGDHVAASLAEGLVASRTDALVAGETQEVNPGFLAGQVLHEVEGLVG